MIVDIPNHAPAGNAGGFAIYAPNGVIGRWLEPLRLKVAFAAPGVIEHIVSDRYDLPVDVEVFAVQPHAHNLARRMEAGRVDAGGPHAIGFGPKQKLERVAAALGY